MDEFKMTDPDTLRTLSTLMVCFIGGVLVGYTYFRALQITTDILLHSGQPLVAVALTLGRLALICAAFYFAVQAGGPALIATLTGVLGMKAILVHQVGWAER